MNDGRTRARGQTTNAQAGGIRYRRLVGRDDTAYLMSSPEMVRRLDAAMRNVLEGRYTLTTVEELEARLHH